MNAALYNSQFGWPEPDTLGINWGSVIGQIGGASAQTGLQWLLSPHAGNGSACMQSQVSGDSAMSACVPLVMSQFDALQSQAAFMAPGDVVAAANQIASIFSNPQYFDQGIGGHSKEIREAAKVQARQRADAIIAAVTSAAAAQNVTVDPATGTITPATTGSGISLDTTTIVMFGGAALVLLMLLKN